MVMSPLVNFALSRDSISTGAWPKAPKPRSIPTALSTEPSMAPIGGTKNPPMKRLTDTMRHTQNAVVFFIRFPIFYMVAIVAASYSFRTSRPKWMSPFSVRPYSSPP